MDANQAPIPAQLPDPTLNPSKDSKNFGLERDRALDSGLRMIFSENRLTLFRIMRYSTCQTA
jgi:hypothetical protein